MSPAQPHNGASQMSDQCDLREKVRELIRGRTLPNRRPDRMWGGPGAGVECAICRASVTADEVEFEIEFARNDNDAGFDTYHVHVHCHAAWESERHEAAAS